VRFRLIVEDRDTSHLAVLREATHIEFFQALGARNHEEFVPQQVRSRATLRRVFLLLLEYAFQGRASVDAEGLDLQLSLL
jgi:hypothetical protein